MKRFAATFLILSWVIMGFSFAFLVPMAWDWLGEGGPADPGCLDRERRGVPSLALMASGDGKWLYASMTTGLENSDIGLMDLDALAAAGAATR